MFPDFIEAEAPGLTLGVPAVGAHRGEVVVAVDDRGLIEVGAALGVRGDDERVQRQRERAIAVPRLVEQRL
ncbi:MAG TPA: hypothetical protein VFD67_09770 [Gemmatimonadaceae bacterium]|nr:hypothetical protein [Gemmatimonadaceae bacterium]